MVHKTFTNTYNKPCVVSGIAYYLDYQQDRPGYVNGFFTELANWEFAEMNYDGAVTPDKAQEL